MAEEKGIIHEIKEDISLKGEYPADARSHRLAAISSLILGLAHEIRNPLAVIRSGLDILKKEPRDAEYLNKFSEKYSRHIDRIESVVQRILDLGRREERKTDEAVNLNEVAEKALERVPLRDNITIIKELNAIPEIVGVREDLEKAVFNLIENALCAMPQGGTLTILTIAAPGKVHLKISDTGVGIPQQHMEKIFDPFFQPPRSRRPRPPHCLSHYQRAWRRYNCGQRGRKRRSVYPFFCRFLNFFLKKAQNSHIIRHILCRKKYHRILPTILGTSSLFCLPAQN
jgi:signal transduction histidine kinase